MSEGFSRLRIARWRQFEGIDLDLSGQVTILTGENGTGKSTILTILGDHFDRTQFPFISSPAEIEGSFQFIGGPTGYGLGSATLIAEIDYLNGLASTVTATEANEPQFRLTYSPKVEIQGILLDSHRTVTGYQKVDTVPAKFSSPAEMATLYMKQVRAQQRAQAISKNPAQVLKESLIAAALYSEGNRSMRADPVAAQVWSGFQQVLHLLFPKSLGFVRLYIDNGEVIIETRSESFTMEASSGGLAAIVDLSWQIFLASFQKGPFTVCFDEPENHLHPSLQRSLMPGLIEAFPMVRFIIATHSAFLVTSVRNATVYALRKDRGAHVYSEVLDFEGQAIRADEVLRDVLGVDSSLPMWAEDRLSEIVRNFESSPVTKRSVRLMQTSLEQAGLRFTFPEILPDAIPDAE